MSGPPPTDTTTLIATLRELATAIQSDEGLAEAALIEAADRMEAMHSAIVAAIGKTEAIYHATDELRFMLGMPFRGGKS